jgi:hypothetical protein
VADISIPIIATNTNDLDSLIYCPPTFCTYSNFPEQKLNPCRELAERPFLQLVLLLSPRERRVLVRRTANYRRRYNASAVLRSGC